MTTEPPWFKDQVADLADLVQTIYASTTALQADGESPGPTGLHTDALRLVQFTRTLGYLASPPPRGEAEIDLSKLSEELLRSAGAAADAPRFMMRTDEPLSVRANKELLVQALDAIIVLARLCAGPEGEVRLTGKRTNAQTVSLTLAFPSGPLDGLRPDQIIVPYALRATLPDMGKNALRAAARIVEGQGGTLELSEAGTSRLCFTLTLPAV
jgi:signal transduction histidine kinase